MEIAPRLIRPVPPPLAGYLRPGRNDHTALVHLLSERTPAPLSGIVVDPLLVDRQEELYTEIKRLKLEAVLDTRAMELATPGGLATRLSELPWAPATPHRPTDLKGEKGRDFVKTVVEFVLGTPSTAVLAPTHLLSGAGDQWLDVDSELVHELRSQLDSAERASMPIYYPLAVRSSTFRQPDERRRLKIALSRLPAIDAIWLRIQPFGSRSGAGPLRGFLEACQDFHGLGLPIVAERVGTIGLPLLAFGAVGGIESGVTVGEHFDISQLMRLRRPGKPFLPPPRVYISSLCTFLDRERAAALFANRQMKSAFACRDTECCRRGSVDMLGDPRRHFLIRRMAEIDRLSKAPAAVRPQLYMDEVLRPATDNMVRATKIDPHLDATRKKLESWRYTLGALANAASPRSSSAVPQGLRIQTRRGA